MVLSLILGILVGGIMGLSGAGGGILAVPALVGGLGWTVQEAAPVALIAVGSGASIGALHGLRRGQVRYRAAMLMAAVGAPCTSPGVQLAHRLSPQWLSGAFALLLLVLATRLIRQTLGVQHGRRDSKSPVGRLHPVTGRFVWTWPTALALSAIGGCAGFVSGLLGVGGGFIIVPLLRRFTRMSMHGIAPTSLLVIALVSIGGVASALLHGATPPFGMTVLFSAAAIAGTLIGRQFAQRLSPAHVQLGFAALLVLVALRLLAQTQIPA